MNYIVQLVHSSCGIQYPMNSLKKSPWFYGLVAPGISPKKEKKKKKWLNYIFIKNHNNIIKVSIDLYCVKYFFEFFPAGHLWRYEVHVTLKAKEEKINHASDASKFREHWILCPNHQLKPFLHQTLINNLSHYYTYSLMWHSWTKFE